MAREGEGLLPRLAARIDEQMEWLENARPVVDEAAAKVEPLRKEVLELRLRAQRFYRPDGTWFERDADEVVQMRIAAAARMRDLEAENRELRKRIDKLDEFHAEVLRRLRAIDHTLGASRLMERIEGAR